MLRGLIFDMDGVIADNNAFHKTSWQAYGLTLGKRLTDEDIETKVYGKTNKEILEYVMGGPMQEADIEYHAEAKEALFREMYAPHFELTPGLLAFLDKAKAAGIPMAVATNAPASNLTFTLERGVLAPYFNFTVHAAQVVNPKPAPDLYLAAAAGIGAQPSDCIVFEDSFTGIAAAKAAGCKVCGVASTYPADALATKTDMVIKDFTSLELAALSALLS